MEGVYAAEKWELNKWVAKFQMYDSRLTGPFCIFDVFQIVALRRNGIMEERPHSRRSELAPNGMARPTRKHGREQVGRDVTITRIIASISRSLRWEALLMKRTRLTKVQLFVRAKRREARARREWKPKSTFSATRDNPIGVNAIHTPRLDPPPSFSRLKLENLNDGEYFPRFLVFRDCARVT